MAAELGRGAMGAVFRAVHRQLGRWVALKVIAAGDRAGETERRRFIREARLSAALEHPGIVRIYEVSEEDGLLYIAYELIEGGTLREVLEHGRLTAEEAVRLITAVADALSVAHARGIVHRDLKPANVLIRPGTGAPVVADLGLGRDLNLASSLTKTGGLVGTPAYMAPEQIKGAPATPAADVFALGVILYEALAGRPPFRGGNLALRYAAILAKPPAPPSDVSPDVPAWLDALCLQALAPRAEDRPPNAGAFADALRSREAAPGPRGRRTPLRVVLGLLAGGCVLALAAVLALRSRKPVHPPPGPTSGDATTADPIPDREATLALERAAAVAAPERRLAAVEEVLARFPGFAPALALRDDLRPWRGGVALSVPGRAEGGRQEATACYAPDRRQMLLFGGRDSTGSLNDIWAWSGTSWRAPDVGSILPPPRYAHAAAYDARRRRLVVYGGIAPTSPRCGDTWEWDGASWALAPASADGPGDRCWHAMVWDEARRRVVLFGGNGPAGLLNDLWSWDGDSWTQLRPPPPLPPKRDSPGIAYDPIGQRVLVFGGYDGRGCLGDLWAFDGVRWVELTQPGAGPSARQATAMAHDGARLLLFGGLRWEGRSPFVLGDTWSFDGDGWTELHPVASPGPRHWHTLVRDPERGVLALFGGVGPPNNSRPAEVWEY